MTYATKPPVPENCILVLLVTDGIVHGWHRPDSFAEQDNQWKSGTTFVFLTQKTIDTYIPSHSEEVDEQHNCERENTQPHPDA